MWDIRFFFARRGGENIDSMTKNTFKLSTDPATNIKYIEKIADEETKNHKETDGQIITGFMPEMENNHKMCPVQSFLTYLYSLSKESDALWQSPKFTEYPEDPKVRVYYGPTPIGHDTHEKFVGEIAKNCKLEEFGYTNHSLRVSAINILTRDNFTNKQIMSITGHKSSTSLETYQRVSAPEKILMGQSLSNILITSNAVVPYVPPKQQTPKIGQIAEKYPIQNNQIVPLECNIVPENSIPADLEISDQELIKMINETEENHQILMSQSKEVCVTNEGSSTVVATNTVTKKKSPQIPIFAGCTFNANVTININN